LRERAGAVVEFPIGDAAGFAPPSEQMTNQAPNPPALDWKIQRRFIWV
jgi:hypothetical protein